MIGRSRLLVGAALLGVALVVGVAGGVVADRTGPDRDDVVARSDGADGGVTFGAEEGDYTIYAVVPVAEHGRLSEEGRQEEAVRGMHCTVERPGEADPLGIDGGPAVFDHIGEATSVGWFGTAAGEVAVSCRPSVPLQVRAGRVGGPAGVVRSVVAPALGLVGLLLLVSVLWPRVSAVLRGRPPPPPPPASET